MKTESIKLVCFSPTGTSKRVAQGIAHGISSEIVETIDITLPSARENILHTRKNDLLIVAVPVYMGRVPALLEDWLNTIEADNTPAVCVVVYGNRAYENAMLELKDVLTKRGCVPVAGAAYIGEHSFSSSDLPTAVGRPDQNDLHHAEIFGKKIKEKLLAASSINDLAGLNIPGEYPYGGITELWNVDFIEVNDECTQCGVCASVCPLGAIDSENSGAIDIEKCITCCACIKSCPQNARSMKDGPVKDAANRLVNLYSERKEPEYYL